MKKILIGLVIVLVACAIWFAFYSAPPVVAPTVDKSDLIVVDTPKPNEIVKSPLLVEGRARGVWYFEASFPIKFYDGAGKEIAIGIAQAQSDWMTKDFVPFKAQLEFKKPTTDTGTLVLQKDNPSGLPEHDDELRIPIRF